MSHLVNLIWHSIWDRGWWSFWVLGYYPWMLIVCPVVYGVMSLDEWLNNNHLPFRQWITRQFGV